MRIIALLALLCTFCEVALAQAPECQSIPKASDRLACYDKAVPPKALGKRAASKTSAAQDKQAAPSAAQDKQAAPATAAEQGQVVDMLAAENSKLDARLKTICRGC